MRPARPVTTPAEAAGVPQGPLLGLGSPEQWLKLGLPVGQLLLLYWGVLGVIGRFTLPQSANL